MEVMSTRVTIVKYDIRNTVSLNRDTEGPTASKTPNQEQQDANRRDRRGTK